MFEQLGDRISSSYLRLAIYHEQLSNKMKESLARDAFLEIVSLTGISPVERENLLLDICNQYPLACQTVPEEEIRNHFYLLLSESLRLRKYVSPEEMHWVSNMVHNFKIRIEIEEAIYRYLLVSSDFNVKRRQFGWSLDSDLIFEIVKAAIANEDISLERRIEIAQEFGEPSEKLECQYYASLIKKKDYDQLEKLGSDMEDVVISVIIHKINNMLFEDAIEVITKLLPKREDLLRETIDLKLLFEFAKRDENELLK